MNDRARHRRGRRVGPRRPDRGGRRRAGRTARSRRSTRAAATCCPASSRRTSICARRCFAATPTTCRCSTGCGTRVWPMEAAHTPATLRASARLAAAELLLERHDHGADDGDGARHRRRVRGARRRCGLRAIDRQVHDGLRRAGAGAAAGGDARVDRRERRARASGGTARRTAGCARRSRRASPCRARASCSKRSRRCRRSEHALVHTHASENRATKSRSSASCRAG